MTAAIRPYGVRWGTAAMARASARGMPIAFHDWHRANERAALGLRLLRRRAALARILALAEERDACFAASQDAYRALGKIACEGEPYPGDEAATEAAFAVAVERHDALTDEIQRALMRDL